MLSEHLVSWWINHCRMEKSFRKSCCLFSEAMCCSHFGVFQSGTDSNQGGPKDYSGCQLLHKIWPSGSLSCPTYKPETVLEGLLLSPELQILSHPIISSLVACTKAAFWPCLCLWEGKRNRAACGGCLPLSESSSTAGELPQAPSWALEETGLQQTGSGLWTEKPSPGQDAGKLGFYSFSAIHWP